MMNGFEMRRGRLLAGAALFALALSIGAPAAGQTQTQPEEEDQNNSANPAAPPNAEGAEPGEGEEIVVTGFRASLENAVAEKRNVDQIVEAVSAEDIGKLPDASIGESIARLPGLTSQRTSGRANVIAIRGFGPDFSQTLLNGREQTTTSDNRAVEFDQYPSEIVRQVVVYKSPTASLIGQGLVGTVDIRTIRPLDFGGKQVFAVGGRASYADLGALNSGSEEVGYRVNATYVDQFADDTLGLSVAASYVDEPYQIQEFNAWGYANVDGNALIGGSKSFVTSTQLKRFGIQGTGQWRPAPNFTLTLDGFYSKFEDDQIKRGIELPLGFSVNGDDPATPQDERLTPGFFGASFDPASAQVEDGTIVAGTFPTVEGVVRNDVFEREADLYSFALNGTFEGDDGWNAFFDISYSRTDRNELSLESYSGTGYNVGNGARDTISFRSTPRGTVFDPTLNYSDPNLIRLTDPLGWGGSRVQAGYFNNRIIDDELKQYRVQLERELEGTFLSAIKGGVNFTDREKQLTPDEFFVAIASGENEAAIPEQFLLRPTNLAYLGLGPVVSYDPRNLINAGVLSLDPNAVRDVFAKGYTVEEKLLTFYAQADIEAEFGASVLTGNVGVQAISTDQSSTGFVFPPDGGAFQQITIGDDYWDVLPSLNLSLRLPSDLVFRLALSKQLQRPRLDDMRVSIGYGFNAAEQIIEGGGGNPRLRPYRANAIDFNIEKYFANNGYVALQFFYKDIKSFIYNGVFPFDFAGFPLPDGINAPTTIGELNAPVNVGGGELYGVEAAATLPFAVITQALDGFGITGGVSYTETEVRDPTQPPDSDPTAIPGYSKWVANGTAFFEKWGFNARGSVRYRSGFLGDFTGFGGSPTRRRALKETIVDAQIGYDFQPGSALEGLSIYIQGQNLTDERFASVANPDNPLQVIDYQIYGRRFLAGATFKF